MAKVILLMFMTINVWAQGAGNGYNQMPDGQIIVDIYMTSTCPHCHKADQFLKKIEQQKPWLSVRRFVINQNKRALEEFYQRLRQQDSDDFAVPALFFCGVKWTGFDSDETTGKALLRALNYCHDQIQKEGELTAVNQSVLKRWAPSAYQLTSEKSKVTVLLTNALVDAFNPCALFGLGVFLAFLFVQPTRPEKIVSGMLMLLGLGFAHYLQQAQSSLYYQTLGFLRWPAVGLGLLLMLYYSQLIQTFKKSIWVYLLAFLTALVVLLYQQTCIETNFSLFFEQWSRTQGLNQYQWAFYQLFYQLIYLLPLVLILLFDLYFLSGSRAKKSQRALFEIGRLFILVIGLMLVFYPRGLSGFSFSLLILSPLAVLGWFVAQWKTKHER